jgi:putative regulator of septum formation
VNERWVCKRCFADNDGMAGACQRCGLTRGAEATEADQSAWAGAAPQAAEGGRGLLPQLLRFWWIGALAIVLVVGYFTAAKRDEAGSITDAGTVPVEELRIGDCFVLATDADEISEVDARPCGEAHQYEIFHVATWDREGAYPSDDDWFTFIVASCDPAFEAYVGREYMASVLEVVPLTPTEDGWADGDRVLQCALLDPADASLTSSMRDANR